jgi:hypothetical protein
VIKSRQVKTGDSMLVPDRIDRYVKLLLSKLPGTKEPVFLQVRPIPSAKPNECVPAVNNQIKATGGSIVYGWQIWQTDNLTEAEFHAVWNSPKGEMLDVTPKIIQSINRILFAEDPSIKYIGSPIDNVRINNTGNPLVDDLIRICEARFQMLNVGNRSKMKKVIFKGEELAIFQYLNISQHNIEMYIASGADSGTPCYCGRNLKYYECHGDDLNKSLKNLKEILATVT